MKRTFLFLLFTTALLSPNLIAREVPDALSNSEGDVERDTPISIVILPSIVSQRATLEQRASADLWADQLSQQLESARGIMVVNRASMKKILDERALQSSPAMLSYDFMFRLFLDATGFAPRARWTLIDLSNGNLHAHGTLPWPLQDKTLPSTVKTLSSVLSPPPLTKGGRVRLLTETNTKLSPREMFHAREIEQAFTKAIQKSPALRRVYHLQAADAVEESLLLALGKSELPGGRTFVPQSDWTVEIRFRELRSAGKHVERTPIEIAWRTTPVGKKSGAWTTVKGTLGTLPAATQKAWGQCFKSIDSDAAQAGSDYLQDHVERRLQAETEINKAYILTGHHWGSGSVPDTQRKTFYNHISAAAKLDPTWELPQRQLILQAHCLWDKKKSRTRNWNSLDMDNLKRGMKYLERYPNSPHRERVINYAYGRVLSMLLRVAREKKNVDTFPRDTLSTDQWFAIEQYRIITETQAKEGFEDPSLNPLNHSVSLLRFVMLKTGTPRKECDAWVDGILEAMDRWNPDQPTEYEKQQRRFRSPWAHHEIRVLGMIRSTALYYAKEQNDLPRVKKLLLGAMNDVPVKTMHLSSHVRRLKKYVDLVDDPKITAMFKQWKMERTPVSRTIASSRPGKSPIKTKLRASIIKPSWPRWPSARKPLLIHPKPALVFPKSKRIPHVVAWDKDQAILIFAGKYHPLRDRPMHGNFRSGLTESDTLVSVPLDRSGNPAKTSGFESVNQWLRWPTDTESQTPPPLHVTSALFHDGILYLGTQSAGLVGYDLQKKTTRVWGVKDGFPSDSVFSIHPVDENTLFCTTGHPYPQSFAWTFQPKTGKLRLIDRKERRWQNRLRGLWMHQGKAVGVTEQSIETDLLNTPRRKTLSLSAGHGWVKHHYRPNSSYAVLEADNRRFVSRTDGLHEIEPTGRTIRDWSAPMVFAPRGASLLWGFDNVGVPGDMPFSGVARQTDGTYIYFSANQKIGLFDPNTETWYGPIQIPGTRPQNMSVVAGKLWIQGTEKNRNSVIYILSPEEWIDACNKSGRAWTPEKWKEYTDGVITKSDPLTAAKYLFGLRRFSEAREKLKPLVSSNNPDPMAALLMGWTYEPSAENQPKKANVWYQKMTEHPLDGNSMYTGLMFQTNQAVRQRQWPEAHRLIQDIQKRDFMIPSDCPSKRWLDETRKRVLKKVAKQ